MATQLHPHRPATDEAADRESATSLRWTLYLLVAAFTSPLWGFAIELGWRSMSGRILLVDGAVIVLALLGRAHRADHR